MAPVSVDSGPKPFVSLRPCDSVFERTFPFFRRPSEHPGSVWDRVPFVQPSALLICRPGGLNEPDCVSFKQPFPAPHRSSNLLPPSSSWYHTFRIVVPSRVKHTLQVCAVVGSGARRRFQPTTPVRRADDVRDKRCCLMFYSPAAGDRLTLCFTAR
jgi:hypothetical protein